jgi:hypothetical protein
VLEKGTTDGALVDGDGAKAMQLGFAQRHEGRRTRTDDQQVERGVGSRMFHGRTSNWSLA